MTDQRRDQNANHDPDDGPDHSSGHGRKNDKWKTTHENPHKNRSNSPPLLRPDQTDDQTRPKARRPVVIEYNTPPEIGPDSVAPVPDPDVPLSDSVPQKTSDSAMARAIATGRGRAGRILVWAGGALFSMMLGIAAVDFVASLLTRSPLLAWIAAGLAIIAVTAALWIAVREWRAWLRLGQIETLRDRANVALATADLEAARKVAVATRRLYARREEMAWALARHAEKAPEILDPDAVLGLLETELLGGLDAAARREIERAARSVAAATALVPLALVDVAVALVANLRMIRRIAQIYGGRAGTFGSLRLMRRVFGHLLATGAVAVGDDLISSVAGGGIVSKLSRRFGEGVVNGALTARVGVAAMEVCRPLPFRALPRPKVTALIGRALAGLFGAEGGRGP